MSVLGERQLDQRLLVVNNIQYCADGPAPFDGKDVEGACRQAVGRIKHLPYWLSCGTLLGLVRDGGAIAGDIDIDICIDADWDSDPVDRDELRAAFGSDYTPAYEMLYDQRLVEAMFYDKDRDVFVDVYCQYRNFISGQSWLFAWRSCLSFPERFILDRCEQDTPWGKFVLPFPVEEYLEHHYGENWKTPEPRLDGSWWQAPSRVQW